MSLKERKKRKPRQFPAYITWFFSKQFLFGMLAAAIIAVVLYGIYNITRLPAFTIEEIAVDGGKTISPEQITEVVNQELAGNYFRLIPYRFSYLYPADNIYKSIKNVPKVKDVYVARDGRNKLSIHFTEYIPTALWCEEGSNSGCLFIDETGYAFIATPNLTGGAFLRFVAKDKKPELTKSILDQEKLAGISSFAQALEEILSLSVYSVVVEEEYLTYNLVGGGQLLTSTEISFGDTLQNLETILQSDEFSHLDSGEFNYIDLRFGDKVFVKEFADVASSSEKVVE